MLKNTLELDPHLKLSEFNFQITVINIPRAVMEKDNM